MNGFVPQEMGRLEALSGLEAHKNSMWDIPETLLTLRYWVGVLLHI